MTIVIVICCCSKTRV